MKKIVVLDGKAVLDQKFSFDDLSEFGNVTTYELTPPEQTAERIGNAEIVVTNKVVIDKKIIDSCPNLRFISVLATGYNIIDVEYAKQKGIFVSNVPAYSTDSVVQHTFALILDAVCRISEHDQAVKSGEWSNYPCFSLCKSKLTELSGKTMGIIGYGAIGKKVKLVAEAFGMKILVYTRTPIEGCVSLEFLLNNSDIISLHCPQNKETFQLIRQENIDKMKNGVILINTARGGLLNENAVANALNSGKISFFGADVLSCEPPNKDNPILLCKNTILTSHIAWSTTEALTRLMEETKNNICSFMKGKPIHVVNR